MIKDSFYNQRMALEEAKEEGRKEVKEEQRRRWINQFREGWDPLMVEGALGLIFLAREILKNSESEHKELYLTECVGCCCRNGASYRLFNAIPKFGSKRKSGRHADTGNSSMVVKCYDQAEDLAEEIAKRISPDARRLSVSDGVPEDSIIFKLK